MRVRTRVHVRGDAGHEAWLSPGDTVPEWATVTNPRVLADEPEALAPADPPAADETPAPASEEEPAPAPAPKRARRKAPAALASE